MLPLLHVRTMADTLPRLNVSEFRSGAEGYLEAVPAGELPLPPVQVFNCAREEMPVQRPLYMPEQREPGLLSQVAYPSMLIARLKNCVCLPGGVILPGPDTVLMDSFSAPWEAYYHKHLVGDTQQGWRPQVVPTPQEVIEEPVFFFDYQHIEWFGHFYLDSLTRGWALHYMQSYLGAREFQTLVKSVAQAPYIDRLVEAAGIKVGHVRRISGPVLCRELVVATKAMQIQHYVAPPSALLWQNIRNHIVRPSKSAPKRVYISRRTGVNRPLAEEEAVEKLFQRHGFAVVYPELLPIDEQVNIFANAEFIAGCSGSNMFNIAFQGRCRSCLVLVSPLLVHYSEHFLHYGHQGRLCYVLGYTDPAELELQPGYVHAPWHVDVGALADIVEEWLKA